MYTKEEMACLCNLLPIDPKIKQRLKIYSINVNKPMYQCIDEMVSSFFGKKISAEDMGKLIKIEAATRSMKKTQLIHHIIESSLDSIPHNAVS